MLSPVFAWIVWDRIEAARLDRALDGLEARREPLDIADFDVKPATSEQREASGLYAQAMKLVGDIPPARLTPARDTIEALCATAEGPRDRSEQVAALRAIEAPYQSALEALDRASRLDAAGWDDADRPKRLSMEEMRPRSLAMVNALRVGLLACSGNGDDAAAALLASLRMRRILPISFTAFVPVQTAHSLQSLLTFTSPDRALLGQIQREYEHAADEHAVERRMMYSRAQWIYYVLPGVFSDPSGSTPRRIAPLESIVMAMARPVRDHAAVAGLREFDEALEAARQPWPRKLDAAGALARKYPVRRSSRSGVVSILSRAVMPHAAAASLAAAVPQAAEALARTRASVGAVAVARYRHEHGGVLPASLDDLRPTYLADALIDPYTGTGLRYRRDGMRYKVYSVGQNRQDDGGTWEQRSDLQASRRGDPPDIGISVGAWPSRRP